MLNPQVDGLEVLSSLGGSASGHVYRARRGAGEDVVLKVYHGPGVFRDRVRESTKRLAKGGWPNGVLPVLEEKWGGDLAYCIKPALLDVGADGVWVPRSLQHHLESHIGGAAADVVVRGLAMALAGMHRRGVVHGNLKPGNVMFGKGGGVFLTDWGLEDASDAEDVPLFSDALLYQSPEQLLRGGDGGKPVPAWDVFAFGVLAFRLLAGVFPRCDVHYQKVAPPSGRACGEVCLAVDRGKLAANLCREPELVWPEECLAVVDPELRGVVERCLALDVERRPVSMEEVVGLLEGRAVLGGDEDRGKRSLRVIAWQAACVVLAVVAVYLGVEAARNAERWKDAVAVGDAQAREMRQKEERWERERLGWEASREQAVGALEKKEAEQEAEIGKWKDQLQREREQGRILVEQMSGVGDALFVWVMEKGRRDVPAWEGRRQRLEGLERSIVNFLEQTEGKEGVKVGRALARLQLAEVSLAAGEEGVAVKRLDEAYAAVSEAGLEGKLRMRMATNRVLMAILKQKQSAEDAGEAFAVARKALEGAAGEGVDVGRIEQMGAALDLHEAQVVSAAGRQDDALVLLHRAAATLQRLADGQMEVPVLRSDLAAVSLLSADMQEGIGRVVEAGELRERVKGELEKVLVGNPADMGVRMQLAGCLTAMVEAKVVAGEAGAAESLLAEAMGHVDEVLRSRPESGDARVLRAELLGLRAGLLRDRGFAVEAKEDYGLGIRILEHLLATTPGPSMASYRLADLLWQQGRMVGMDGDRSAEVEMLERARALLSGLEERKGVDGLRVDQIRRSAVYLLGDLGHSLQVDGKKDKALEVFREALVRWEALSRGSPDSEEFSEGLLWCRQRVKELEIE